LSITYTHNTRESKHILGTSNFCHIRNIGTLQNRVRKNVNKLFKFVQILQWCDVAQVRGKWCAPADMVMNSGSHKMHGISQLAQELLFLKDFASQFRWSSLEQTIRVLVAILM
jgi:hypothetical protein